MCHWWNGVVSTAGSGPQAVAPEGELQFLFVVTVAYANPDKLCDFHFFGCQNLYYEVDSAALEIELDQRFYLIYKADRKTIALILLLFLLHKKKPYAKIIDLRIFWGKILLKVGDILPFLLLSKVASTLMFLQRWISKLAPWCITAWLEAAFSTSALRISDWTG